MDTIYKVAYTLAIIGVLVTLVLLFIELIKGLKKVSAKADDLIKMKDGLEKIQKDVNYIREVKEKTFLDELLLVLAFVKDFSIFNKQESSKTTALYKAAKKELPKASLSQLKNKIKAL